MELIHAINILEASGKITPQLAAQLREEVEMPEVGAAALKAAEAAASAVADGSWTVVSVVLAKGSRIYYFPPSPKKPSTSRASGGRSRTKHSPELVEFAKRYYAEHGLKWFNISAALKIKHFREAARAAGFNVPEPE